ncbi:LEAF RUST 10 DISEASE-RESISTANCE LOCUS RECEPTOR-LIKE PROTEIN KINASE-like 1.4 isoform X2 [Durio zibethinus]|uniref:non-specific serine/threonine protein kinase n=1 Tax=Durio zibethinus TaxID=66656 RepID=A0A6P6B4A2_DURZI|nr:LEAF RUST 10 DISEASE-RESISTANCE LOCUS RECEPTOR-LIKE PROTEIN KINASE-like 1.4 isoform X2 [Durio zibethinus]
MNHRRSPSSLFPLLIIFVFQVVRGIPQSLGYPHGYTECSDPKFKCWNISTGYPFLGDGIPWGCGHPGLQLYCENDTPTIEIVNVKYQVLDIDRDRQTLRIARQDFIKNDLCNPEFPNSTLDYELFDFVHDPPYSNVTLLYGCRDFTPTTFLGHLNCPENIKGYKDFWVGPAEVISSVPCSANVTVPVLRSPFAKFFDYPFLLGELNKGFEVKWKLDSQACPKCIGTGGACGFGPENQTICYCLNEKNLSYWEETGCPPRRGEKKTNVGRTIGLAIAGAVIAGILLGVGFFSCRQQRRKKIADQIKSRDLPTPPSNNGPPTSTSNLSQTIHSHPISIYGLEKGSTYFGAHVFSYEELEEATENFNPSKELGEGGFGTVYYGVLNDGRVVAVKRLYESNFKRVDQYMNEIAILTRIRHPNLVTLYGCTSRRSRELLLVYEYIPNGTVADHLHGKLSNSGLLTWPVRLNIAVETANALAYLHATDIIHRDVKTNNILLDENFRVKVADFGLSRLFPNDVTHVSTAPQGTPGYVDPEYYQCYQLTEKSDVYSFGVVLIELISAKQAVDTNRHRHDINLAKMAVSRIQNHALHELVDPSLGFENDFAVKRMVTAVAELAFQCLQQERDMRPSMEEVLETLREIHNEELGVQTAEVVDIRSDDVGLLKHIPPPLSPDSVTDKWMQIRSM